jgi:hypothetical protein
MKRYYLLLGVFMTLAVIVGLADRRNIQVQPPKPIVTIIPQSTAVYEWGEIEIEPFLYAVPLGTFTPYSDISVFDLPVATAQVVGVLVAGDAVGYTSEYTFDGETWLCVKWTVDEDISSWNCSGWVPASAGTVDRDWEYSPNSGTASQEA